MKRIRYLSLLMLLMSSINVWGQSGFNPDSPEEPSPAATRLVLKVTPSDAGYTSGSGRYVPQSSVDVRAYPHTGFTFDYWTDSRGNKVSGDQYFSFTKGKDADTLTAHFSFDPDNPADPEDPRYTLYYRLSLSANEGGSVSGGGRYLADNTVYLYAYPNTGFDFDGWYDSDGNKLSASTQYDYTMPGKTTKLTARFKFNPDNPDEPSDPILRHNVMATATEGGYTNISSVRDLEGSSVYVSASNNTGYVFDGWYVADTLYTKMSSFSYTIGKENISFVARFHFDPDNPNEPGAVTDKLSAIYLMNIIGKPGDTVRFPVYLNSLTPLEDMSFQLTFDPSLKPNLDSVGISAKAEGYTVSYSAVSDTVYSFSFIGGSYPVTNSALVVFDVAIPDTLATGKGYPVKVNQVSVALEDGTTTTTSTRNGRVSVYKLGDSNGDDEVNILDHTNIKGYILNKEVKTFIEEVSDVAGDGNINVLDLTQLKSLILNNE